MNLPPQPLMKAPGPMPVRQNPPQALAGPTSPAVSPWPQAQLQQQWVLQMQGLVSQIGKQTALKPDGNVFLNYPLIETIVRQRENAVPFLCQYLSGAQTMLTMVEGLYTAQRLAEERVQNVQMLYGVTQHWHNNPHPLVQIYLSGFYRKLNAPQSLGPLLSMLVKNAVTPGPAIPAAFNPQEEVGGAILDLIANKAADETLRRLQPYLASRTIPKR